MSACGTCHRVRGFATKALDAAGVSIDRIILANRPGRIQGVVQATFTVKMVRDGVVSVIDPESYPEGWPDKDQAGMFALDVAQKLKMMVVSEFVSPQRLAVAIATYV